MLTKAAAGDVFGQAPRSLRRCYADVRECMMKWLFSNWMSPGSKLICRYKEEGGVGAQHPVFSCRFFDEGKVQRPAALLSQAWHVGESLCFHPGGVDGTAHVVASSNECPSRNRLKTGNRYHGSPPFRYPLAPRRGIAIEEDDIGAIVVKV